MEIWPNEVCDRDNREVGMVWMVMNNTGLGLQGLLLDSGAFSHMFSERERFISYTEANDGQLVTVSGLNHTPVVSHGSVSFRAKLLSGQITLVTLQNVLHVPSLGANLVSLGVLQHEGASYSSQNDGVIVSLGDQELFYAVLKNTGGFLYFITCAKDTDRAAFSVYEGSMRLWYRRMGHIGPRTINLMQRKGFVNGLDLMAPNNYDHVCTGCAHGKSHRKPMPGTSNTKYGKMELVIMDLTGPISVPTWDGYVLSYSRNMIIM